MNQPSNVFQHDQYIIRRKVWKFLGAAFHIYDQAGNIVGYSKQKAFKLREDIRVFTDPSANTELLAILARKVVDFSASYDVVDPLAGQPVGTLRRKGLKSSFLRDEWLMFDAAGREVGLVHEESAVLALVRRYMLNVFPQKFTAVVGGNEVATFKQNFNPFVHKLQVNILPGADQAVDRRLLLAAGILLVAIEGRQQS